MRNETTTDQESKRKMCKDRKFETVKFKIRGVTPLVFGRIDMRDRFPISKTKV